MVARRLKPSRATASTTSLAVLYTTVVRLGFKRRATAELKSNLIRSIEFGTAVARRLKRLKTQPQTSKTSEQRLACHQQNDGGLQKFADHQILC